MHPDLCVWIAGRKTGFSGCGLLHHPVQAPRPPTHGAWSEQLQALSGPQPVRDPQEPLHQHHAGVQRLGPLSHFFIGREWASLHRGTQTYCPGGWQLPPLHMGVPPGEASSWHLSRVQTHHTGGWWLTFLQMHVGKAGSWHFFPGARRHTVQVGGS